MDSEMTLRELLMDTLLSSFLNSVPEKRKNAYALATQDIPYETLRRAVSSTIRSWQHSSAPPISAVRDRCAGSNRKYPVERHRARDVAIRFAVWLPDDPHTVAGVFEHSADQSHADVGTVDVGVAGNEDYIESVPAARQNFVLCGRQEHPHPRRFQRSLRRQQQYHR